MKLSCSAKKKQPPPDPSPEAGPGRPRGRPRGGPRGTGRQAWRHALSRWPKGYGSRKESSSTQQNHIAPREARTPDLEVNSLTL